MKCEYCDKEIDENSVLSDEVVIVGNSLDHKECADKEVMEASLE
jgi:hypothetical protein